jgi:hypothetical protein
MNSKVFFIKDHWVVFVISHTTLARINLIFISLRSLHMNSIRTHNMMANRAHSFPIKMR